MLAQIMSNHFCAGILLQDDIVIDAAPIVRYMIGWNRDRVRSYCHHKKWNIAIVKPLSSTG